MLRVEFCPVLKDMIEMSCRTFLIGRDDSDSATWPWKGHVNSHFPKIDVTNENPCKRGVEKGRFLSEIVRGVTSRGLLITIGSPNTIMSSINRSCVASSSPKK